MTITLISVLAPEASCTPDTSSPPTLMIVVLLDQSPVVAVAVASNSIVRALSVPLPTVKRCSVATPLTATSPCALVPGEMVIGPMATPCPLQFATKKLMAFCASTVAGRLFELIAGRRPGLPPASSEADGSGR